MTNTKFGFQCHEQTLGAVIVEMAEKGCFYREIFMEGVVCHMVLCPSSTSARLATLIQQYMENNKPA